MIFACFVANNECLRRNISRLEKSKSSFGTGNPKGKQYAEYCRLSLMKFRPWEGKLQAAEKSEKKYIQAWEEFQNSPDFTRLGVHLLADRAGLDEARQEERAEASLRHQDMENSRIQDDDIGGDFQTESILSSVYDKWCKSAGASLQDFDGSASYRALVERMLNCQYVRICGLARHPKEELEERHWS